jgi:hypothetical protein
MKVQAGSQKPENEKGFTEELLPVRAQPALESGSGSAAVSRWSWFVGRLVVVATR